LADPKLEIYNAAGVKLTENDTWSPGLATTFASVGAFALAVGSRDAALLTSLPPGSYTAQIRGSDGGTGEALVEIYELR
jgi:7-keto-8-aminopelargonate synthetase-like enzyme